MHHDSVAGFTVQVHHRPGGGPGHEPDQILAGDETLQHILGYPAGGTFVLQHYPCGGYLGKGQGIFESGGVQDGSAGFDMAPGFVDGRAGGAQQHGRAFRKMVSGIERMQAEFLCLGKNPPDSL